MENKDGFFMDDKSTQYYANKNGVGFGVVTLEEKYLVNLYENTLSRVPIDVVIELMRRKGYKISKEANDDSSL